MIPIDILDSLVKALKAKPEFASVRFIYGGKSTPAEKPVESFLVACSVGKTQREVSALGFEESAELEFTVYAPHNSGRRELTAFSGNLYHALEECDAEKLISRIKLASAVYDSDICTQYQRVTAVVNYSELQQETEEDSEDNSSERDIPINVNGGFVSGVTAFEEIYTKEYYSVKEFLGGITGRVLPVESTQMLEIKCSNPVYIFELEDIPYLTVENLQTGRAYQNCSLRKARHSLSKEGEVLYVYTLETGVTFYNEGCDAKNV